MDALYEIGSSDATQAIHGLLELLFLGDVLVDSVQLIDDALAVLVQIPLHGPHFPELGLEPLLFDVGIVLSHAENGQTPM